MQKGEGCVAGEEGNLSCLPPEVDTDLNSRDLCREQQGPEHTG